jgi:hypothetical protein
MLMTEQSSRKDRHGDLATRETEHETMDDMRRIADRLEFDNPMWIVVFGVYSKQFVAFPRFAAPKGTIIAVRYPGAMPARMCKIEQAARIVRASSTESAA